MEAGICRSLAVKAIGQAKPKEHYMNSDLVIGTLLPLIRDFLAIVAAIVGLLTFNRWRTELTWKSKLEAAREIIKLARQFEAQFHVARDPFTYSNESEGRPKREDEPAGKKQRLDEAFARARRLEPLRRTVIELQTAVWEADILFKKDIEQLIKPLIDAYANLAFAVESTFDEYIEYTDPKERITYKRKVYGTSSDEFGQSVTTGVKQLGHELRQELNLRRK